MSARDRQIGGDWYKQLAIQPTDYIVANKLDWCEGNAIKYITRHKLKGGRESLEKAIHYLELLIEQKYPNAQPQSGPPTAAEEAYSVRGFGLHDTYLHHVCNIPPDTFAHCPRGHAPPFSHVDEHLRNTDAETGDDIIPEYLKKTPK